MSFVLLTEEVEEQIVTAPRAERERWLVLDPHKRFMGHWAVHGFGSGYRFDLFDVIGAHHVVSCVGLDDLLDLAKEFDYRVAFTEDPEGILEPYRRLSEPPPVYLDSTLPGTVNGLLPFQARGFNYLYDLPRGGMANWSTGCGKSALQAALLRYHRDSGNFRICWSLAKNHNKVNTQRTYRDLAGIEAILLDGTAKQRERSYQEIAERMQSEPVAVVANYEKFRDDFCTYERGKSGEWIARLDDAFLPFFEVDTLVLWDEAPTKLKTRSTKLYRGVQACFYDAPYPIWDKRRAPWLRQYIFSATPVENSPEDVFNVFRLVDPDLFGTVKEFREKYVSRYSHFDPNKPEKWHRLDEMALAMAHVVHQVDKEHDPEIAAQFPDVLPDQRVLDWSPPHLATYNKLIDLAEKSLDEAEQEGEPINVLALITVLQMYCDLPSMVTHSAALREAWDSAAEDADEDAVLAPLEGSKVAAQLLALLEGKMPADEDHTKVLELKSILLDEYPDEKVIVFSRFNKTLLPSLERLLDKWGVTYVAYTGSIKQLQEAQDRFRDDPSVRVFLTSDRGSDSINLEAGRILVNYDLPLLWSRLKQRVNRNNRLTSTFAHTVVIDLVMAGSVELRVLEIILRKKGYHEALFSGVIADQAIGAALTGTDLAYILRGR